MTNFNRELSDFDYAESIIKIDKILEIYFKPISNFERHITNRCQEAGSLVELIQPSLKVRLGFTSGSWHLWNYDVENNVIIDLSAWQFYDIGVDRSKFVFDPSSELHKQDDRLFPQHFSDSAKPEFKRNIENLLDLYHQF